MAARPLVAAEVWYRVQAVLTAHQTSGEKTQAHDHYLKGSLYCGQCGSRLTLTNAKSRRGVIYPYFMCTGRHARRTNCERKSMFVPDIEAAVEDSILDQAIEAIEKSANTGKIGDGKIFVFDLEQVVRIRTGETGEAAL